MTVAMHPLYLEPPLNTAVIKGRRQAWRETGGGERLPLFLLHGIGSNSRAWAGQFGAFGSERRVIAWNAPGYSHSDPFATDWPSPSDYADAALQLLDHVQVAQCILVGQSLGAVMATALARRAPTRIAALVLASPASGYGIAPGDPFPEKVSQRLIDLQALGPIKFAERRASNLLTAAASPEALEIVRRAMEEVTTIGYTHAARLLACADLARDVCDLLMPRAVVWGSSDVITPPKGCRRIADAANCTGIELDGLSHGFATEAPHRFNDSIRPLIAAAEERRAA